MLCQLIFVVTCKRWRAPQVLAAHSADSAFKAFKFVCSTIKVKKAKKSSSQEVFASMHIMPTLFDLWLEFVQKHRETRGSLNPLLNILEGFVCASSASYSLLRCDQLQVAVWAPFAGDRVVRSKTIPFSHFG